METLPLTADRLRQAGIGYYFRPRDVEPLGVAFSRLKRLVAAGTVEKVDRGLYRLAAADIETFETVAMVAASAPGAIVCLLTALRIHEIGTQSPYEVWLAIDRKARKPSRLPARTRIVRFSGTTLTYGVQTREILGAPVRITSPARTVVDCFRYRNKIGIDVALEALRDAVLTRTASMDDTSRAADVCRVRTVIRPYMEALSV